MTTTHIDEREIAEAAREAARIMEDKGKATGDFEDSQGRVCVVQSIVLATQSQSVRAALLCRLDRRQDRGVIAWNELSTTTAEDIARELRQVADEALALLDAVGTLS